MNSIGGSRLQRNTGIRLSDHIIGLMARSMVGNVQVMICSNGIRAGAACRPDGAQVNALHHGVVVCVFRQGQHSRRVHGARRPLEANAARQRLTEQSLRPADQH